MALIEGHQDLAGLLSPNLAVTVTGQELALPDRLEVREAGFHHKVVPGLEQMVITDFQDRTDRLLGRRLFGCVLGPETTGGCQDAPDGRNMVLHCAWRSVLSAFKTNDDMSLLAQIIQQRAL